MTRLSDKLFEFEEKPLQLTDAFKALGDSNRLKIVRLISEREMCAIELLEKLEISQPTLSHHMKVLVNASIVKTRKTGAQVNYSINSASVKDILLVLSEMANFSELCAV